MAEPRCMAEVLDQDGQLTARELLDPQAMPRPMSMPARLPGQGEPPGPGDVVVVGRRAESDSRAWSLIALLARAGSFQADLYRLGAAHGLSPLFPASVMAEVEAFLASPGIDDPRLEDLEHLPFITIDNDGSRDLDQAMFLERHTSGSGYVVWYALADASYYVGPGSALLDEALGRGSSFYMPGLSLPMLPRALSEGLISLNQDQPRRSLVLEMHLDLAAVCRSTRVHRARIRSRRQLSYSQVQRAWDDPASGAFRGQPFEQSLGLLREVGGRCIEQARQRHVVRYHRREVEVLPGEDGGPGSRAGRGAASGQVQLEVVARERLEVECCNEQISLMANVQGARLLEKGRGKDYVQPVFRVHPEPGPERLDELEAMIAAVVGAHDLDRARWCWHRADEPLADYLERLPRRARPRVAEAIDRQAVMTNRRSIFAESPGRHHGIGASVYARFSSPMREVVGVFTHKEALELLGGQSVAAPSQEDELLRDAVVDAGNRSRSIQRTLTKEVHALVLERLLRPELNLAETDRPVRRGTLLGMKPALLYVRLDDPPLEVKIHLRDLERLLGVRWRPDRSGVVARPPDGASHTRLRVGDAVELRLAGWKQKHRRWLFIIDRI